MNPAYSIVPFVLSLAMLQVFRVLARNTRLMDIPNERSLHAHPIIRGGGVVFIGLFLCSFPFIGYQDPSHLKEWLVFMMSTFILALVSFLDDFYCLSAKLRFLVQVLASLLIVLFIRPDHLDFFICSITNQYVIGAGLFITLIWATNHFNFMDGLDGFCAMQSLFLLAAYLVFFSFKSSLMPQNLCWVLACSLVGFLIFNFPPAKLFMGDVGSASLGFIIFVLAIIGQKNYQIPIIYWFILNGLFLFDATITLLRRVWHKEKWFIAHKKHAYQRLRQFGWSSKRILLGQFALNTLFFVLALLHHHAILHLSSVVFMQLAMMMGVYFFIERCFPMYRIAH